MNHWMILPILLPAMVAPLLALAVRHDLVLARTFSLGSTVLLVLLGILHLNMAADGEIRTYALGNWPPPFGIVLVLDRLAALMLLLTAVLGLSVLLYAINGCDRRGMHFHPLFQFQLMGLNGAFLTGDLFNLFVFYEVLLIASYGLMVHGGGAARTRAGIQYVIVNLVGSSIFLIGLGLIYGVAGTLNIADFARRLPLIPAGDQAILYTGLTLLFVVFGIKAALVPFQFWLPGTYANTSGPVAALFSIMTKVGAYSILRVYLLAFGETPGADTIAAASWMMAAAAITLTLGMVGVVASRSLSQQASFAALASMGTLLIAMAMFTPRAETAALYYLVHSTLAIAALFLLVDAILIRRSGFGDALVLAPAFRHMGLIGGMFLATVIAVIGLPPLSGFVGKLLILDAVGTSIYWGWLWGVILITSLFGLIGFASSGSLVFWKSTQLEGELEPAPLPQFQSGERPQPADEPSSPQRRSSDAPGPSVALPMVAVGTVLAALVLLTGFSGPVTAYMRATANQLFEPSLYIEAVLSTESTREFPSENGGH